MARLTDTQLVILSTASRRDDRGVDLPTDVTSEGCQSALDWDPLSASKRDPFERRVLAVALARSELAGVAETARARAGT